MKLQCYQNCVRFLIKPYFRLRKRYKPQKLLFLETVRYITGAMLRYLYGFKDDRLSIICATPNKLNQFFFAKCINVMNYNFSEGGRYDIAIDCAGGSFPTMPLIKQLRY